MQKAFQHVESNLEITYFIEIYQKLLTFSISDDINTVSRQITIEINRKHGDRCLDKDFSLLLF